MKKLTILILLLISFSFASEAQMKLGVKAGINMATISGDNTDGAGMIPGYQAGIAADYSLGDAFSIQPGLILSGKGSENAGFTLLGLASEYTVSLNYLEIPVNAVYNVYDFQIFAGPYLGLGLFGKARYDNDEIDDKNIVFTDNVTEVPEGMPVNSLDYGLNVGAGYLINESIQIQANYGLGLGNLNPEYNGEEPADKISNSVIQLSVTYYL